MVFSNQKTSFLRRLQNSDWVDANDEEIAWRNVINDVSLQFRDRICQIDSEQISFDAICELTKLSAPNIRAICRNRHIDFLRRRSAHNYRPLHDWSDVSDVGLQQDKLELSDEIAFISKSHRSEAEFLRKFLLERYSFRALREYFDISPQALHSLKQRAKKVWRERQEYFENRGLYSTFSTRS